MKYPGRYYKNSFLISGGKKDAASALAQIKMDGSSNVLGISDNQKNQTSANLSQEISYCTTSVNKILEQTQLQVTILKDLENILYEKRNSTEELSIANLHMNVLYILLFSEDLVQNLRNFANSHDVATVANSLKECFNAECEELLSESYNYLERHYKDIEMAYKTDGYRKMENIFKFSKVKIHFETLLEKIRSQDSNAGDAVMKVNKVVLRLSRKLEDCVRVISQRCITFKDIYKRINTEVEIFKDNSEKDFLLGCKSLIARYDVKVSLGNSIERTKVQLLLFANSILFVQERKEKFLIFLNSGPTREKKLEKEIVKKLFKFDSDLGFVPDESDDRLLVIFDNCEKLKVFFESSIGVKDVMAQYIEIPPNRVLQIGEFRGKKRNSFENIAKADFTKFKEIVKICVRKIRESDERKIKWRDDYENFNDAVHLLALVLEQTRTEFLAKKECVDDNLESSEEVLEDVFQRDLDFNKTLSLVNLSQNLSAAVSFFYYYESKGVVAKKTMEGVGETKYLKETELREIEEKCSQKLDEINNLKLDDHWTNKIKRECTGFDETYKELLDKVDSRDKLMSALGFKKKSGKYTLPRNVSSLEKKLKYLLNDHQRYKPRINLESEEMDIIEPIPERQSTPISNRRFRNDTDGDSQSDENTAAFSIQQPPGPIFVMEEADDSLILEPNSPGEASSIMIEDEDMYISIISENVEFDQSSTTQMNDGSLVEGEHYPCSSANARRIFGSSFYDAAGTGEKITEL